MFEIRPQQSIWLFCKNLSKFQLRFFLIFNLTDFLFCMATIWLFCCNSLLVCHFLFVLCIFCSFSDCLHLKSKHCVLHFKTNILRLVVNIEKENFIANHEFLYYFLVYQYTSWYVQSQRSRLFQNRYSQNHKNNQSLWDFIILFD